MSKAQMEIFGLVIIVILLAIGLLFTTIILTKEPSRDIQRVKESVMAANFLNTVLSTTTDCQGMTVRELIRDCAIGGEVGAMKCGSLTTSCDVSSYVVKQLLRSTLGKWGQDYQFFITGSDALERLNVTTTECKGEREGSSRPEKIRAGFDVVITLHLCR